ncbi:transporter [Ganoderma sinense ZZ0214-1]|uniref:Transporter n=1 Tax=Ganoderma sinense ZZ0214-1 TaxID=1077348 RepID=A0A2G8S694_9APHY|nr:transporter [Ganoderma sinense ZZ0214-1]
MSKKRVPQGMTPELLDSMQQILQGFKGSDLSDMMRHVSGQDPAMLEAVINAVSDAKEKNQVDLSTFDYASLRIKRDSFWVVQLTQMGFGDPLTGRVADNQFPGSQPVFQIIIYDDRNSYRVLEQADKPGLPPSSFVLQAIQKAMANPIPPLRPQLPEFLLVARKLQQHLPVLKPFLDSFPAPFTWRIETREEEEEVANGVHEMNIAGVKNGIRDAEQEKERGNRAFVNKDRKKAIEHYNKAIDCLLDAESQKPTDAELVKIKAVEAVCFSNRAASWLLPGEGQDAQKALADADRAIEEDCEYAKAYYRKAKALLTLSRTDDAIDALTSALMKPNFAFEKGLNDALVEAYGGFPDTADALRTFCLEKFKNEDGDKRARHVAEFRRRAEAQLKTILGPDATIDSL